MITYIVFIEFIVFNALNLHTVITQYQCFSMPYFSRHGNFTRASIALEEEQKIVLLDGMNYLYHCSFFFHRNVIDTIMFSVQNGHIRSLTECHFLGMYFLNKL